MSVPPMRPVERLVGLACDGVLVRVVSVDHAVEHQPQLDVRRRVDQFGRLVGLVRRRDVHAGAAVVDDVRQLVGRQA